MPIKKLQLPRMPRIPKLPHTRNLLQKLLFFLNPQIPTIFILNNKIQKEETQNLQQLLRKSETKFTLSYSLLHANIPTQSGMKPKSVHQGIRKELRQRPLMG